MYEYLAAGLVLGLSAGLAPGPLLALIVSETVAHGFPSGLKVSLAPLVTDLPIIAATLLLLGNFASSGPLLGAVSMLGACLVFTLGVQSLRTRPSRFDFGQSKPRSLRKGVLVNFFSPHPYLFWLGVGAPMVIKASRISPLGAAGFIASFYVLLVGSKVLLALVVSRSRSFLSSRGYVLTMRGVGLVLCGFALLLVRDGLRLLGVL